MPVGGWPVSPARRWVNRSLRSSINFSALAMTAARSLGGVVGQGPLSNAARAAAPAASTSAAAASGTLPTYSPVAGQCTSMTSEVDGSVHLPPMKSLSYSVLWLSVIYAAPPHCCALHRRRRSWRHPTQAEAKREHVPLSRLEHQHQIADEELPQHRHRRQPPGPSRVVARECRQRGAGAGGPVEAVGRGHRAQRRPVVVFGRMAMLAGVARGGAGTAEGVG